MTISNFEALLLNELARIRKEFADRNIPHMEVTISAGGPTMRDEIKVTFSVDGDYNYRSVEGDTINAVMEEFFRRNTWKKAHDYLALPNIQAVGLDR